MIDQYPDAGDLKEVLESSIPAANARAFFRSKGVIFCSASREFISNCGSMFFLSQRNVNALSEFTDKETNYQRSSRIYLSGVQSLSDVTSELQNLLGRQVDAKVNLRLIEVSPQDQVVTVRLAYNKIKPGRVAMMKRQPRETYLAIKPGGKPGLVVIDFVANDEQDHKHVRSIIAALGQSPTPPAAEVHDIALTLLAPENRIKLFDQFFAAKFGEWRIDEIKGLKVKKPDEADADGDEDEEMPESEMSGITSAILHGTSLRTNKVVNSFLNNGYYFTGSTIRLSSKKGTLSLDLEVSFRSLRGKAETVEMRLTNFREESLSPTSGSNDEEKVGMSESEQWRHSQFFQDTLFKIYQRLLEDQKRMEKVAASKQ